METLLQDARPHIAEQVPCSRCSRKWQVLLGAELNLCLDCLAAARAAAETKTRSDAETETERVRTEYARLFVRAEARLAAQGRRAGRTAEKDIQVPPKSSIGDWFYTEITALE